MFLTNRVAKTKGHEEVRKRHRSMALSKEKWMNDTPYVSIHTNERQRLCIQKTRMKSGPNDSSFK